MMDMRGQAIYSLLSSLFMRGPGLSVMTQEMKAATSWVKLEDPEMADHAMQGWPVHMEGFDIKDKQQVTVTTDDKAEASSSVLPISYRHFAHMCQPGDTLFVGRYLVNGADQSSLYLEVRLTDMSNMPQSRQEVVGLYAASIGKRVPALLSTPSSPSKASKLLDSMALCWRAGKGHQGG